MAEETNVVKTEEQTAIPVQTEVSTGTQNDTEAYIAKLEEEKANYKLAFLKEKSKNKSENLEDESEEERIERIISEKLAATKIAQIDTEKDTILKQLAKENKELKLAQMNKTTTATSMGAHTESIPVQDTTVTPEQLAAFKNRGWSDKDIERYKKNLIRYSGR